MDQRIWPVVIALLGIAFPMIASETKGDEFYYAMIFGSQSKPKLLQYTHTWATFIRAVGEGPDANNYVRLPAHHQLAAAIARRPDLGPVAGAGRQPRPVPDSRKPSIRIANTSRCGGHSGSTRWSTSVRSG